MFKIRRLKDVFVYLTYLLFKAINSKNLFIFLLNFIPIQYIIKQIETKKVYVIDFYPTIME